MLYNCIIGRDCDSSRGFGRGSYCGSCPYYRDYSPYYGCSFYCGCDFYYSYGFYCSFIIN